jgi:hypothetical protein
VVVDMLFNDLFLVMVIPIVTISIPPVIPIPIPVFRTVLVAAPVGVALALFPAVMFPCRGFVALMVVLIVFVLFASSVLSCPCITPESKCHPNQCYAYDQELPFHVDLLRLGLRAEPFGLFDRYDESDR